MAPAERVAIENQNYFYKPKALVREDWTKSGESDSSENGTVSTKWLSQLWKKNYNVCKDR